MDTYVKLEDQDCNGNDFIGANTAGVAQNCADLCDKTAGCVGFVFESNKAALNCHCKNVCEEYSNTPTINTYVPGKAMINTLLCQVRLITCHYP